MDSVEREPQSSLAATSAGAEVLIDITGSVGEAPVVGDGGEADTSARRRVPRAPVFVLMAISAIDQADRFLLSAVFPLIKQDFHLSDSQLGSLSAAFVVFGAVGVIPFGILTDRRTRTRIVAWGVAVWSVAMIVTGLARSYVALFLARMFLGTAEASSGPASFSLISDYYPVRERGKMLGIFQLGAIAGFVFLPVGGLVAGAWGWRAAFHVYAIPGFVLALAAYRLREPSRGLQDAAHQGVDGTELHATSAIAELPTLRAFVMVLKIPTVIVSLLANGLSTFFLSGLGIWTATFLVRYHDMSLVQASSALSLLAAGAIVGALSGGMIGDRLVARGVVAGRLYVAGAAQVAGVFILFPAFGLDNTAAMLVLFGLGAATLTMPQPALAAIRADVLHPDLRGRAASATSLIAVLTGALSPLVFGLLSDSYTLRTAFLATVPWMGAGGILLLLLGPRFLPGDMERMKRQLAGAEVPAP